ncbi:hypothetical protein SDC9_185106 [bioreactor metagenome]|uniref:Uncharacterized protein n=1 Tax=bioreactor metagenome TaxID=1076179 RepID=A0A645HG91_9ZZZZ
MLVQIGAITLPSTFDPCIPVNHNTLSKKNDKNCGTGPFPAVTNGSKTLFVIEGIFHCNTCDSNHEISRTTIDGINAVKASKTIGGTPAGNLIVKFLFIRNLYISTAAIDINIAANIPELPKFAVSITNFPSSVLNIGKNIIKLKNPINAVTIGFTFDPLSL